MSNKLCSNELSTFGKIMEKRELWQKKGAHQGKTQTTILQRQSQ